MLHLQAQIEIDVPVSDAFRLLCDPARKTELNPQVELIHAIPVTEGVLAPGSRIRYCLRTAGGVRNFHCTVTALVPDRCIEMVSDTQPPFRVRQTLEATLYGCILQHDEWIDAGRDQVQEAGRQRPLAFLLRLMEEAAAHSMPTASQMDDNQQDTLRAELTEALEGWLGNIKHYLESAGQEVPDGDSAIAT